MKIIERKKTDWKYELAEVDQRTLEAYFEHYRSLRPDKASASEERGTVCRAAAAAGWIVGLTPEMVDSFPPAKTRWLAEEINSYHTELTTIPPE